MSKQPPPAPTASAVGPCPTLIQIVGRPGTGRIPSTIAPPDHPLFHLDANFTYIQETGKNNCFACLRMLVFDKKTVLRALVGKGWQCVLLIWIKVGQGPHGASGGCLDFYSLSSIISLFFLSLSGRGPDID